MSIQNRSDGQTLPSRGVRSQNLMIMEVGDAWSNLKRLYVVVKIGTNKHEFYHLSILTYFPPDHAHFLIFPDQSSWILTHFIIVREMNLRPMRYSMKGKMLPPLARVAPPLRPVLWKTDRLRGCFHTPLSAIAGSFLSPMMGQHGPTSGPPRTCTVTGGRWSG